MLIEFRHRLSNLLYYSYVVIFQPFKIKYQKFSFIFKYLHVLLKYFSFWKQYMFNFEIRYEIFSGIFSSFIFVTLEYKYRHQRYLGIVIITYTFVWYSDIYVCTVPYIFSEFCLILFSFSTFSLFPNIKNAFKI